MTPTPVIEHCPCGRLDRPPCTRVGGNGECATTAPSRSAVREAHDLAGAARRRDAESDLTVNDDVPAIRGARA